jgi:hypothetical protein
MCPTSVRARPSVQHMLGLQSCGNVEFLLDHLNHRDNGYRSAKGVAKPSSSVSFSCFLSRYGATTLLTKHLRTVAFDRRGAAALAQTANHS